MPEITEPTPTTKSASRGRVTKVVIVDKDLEPIAVSSQQEVNDPFNYGGRIGLQEPPFNPEKLIGLAEMHPIHGAALEQKALDVAGTGWEWEPVFDGAEEKEKEELDTWLRNLADPDRDETIDDIIFGAQQDLETIGHGVVEVARNSAGEVQKLYGVAAHTTRFHKDGKKIAQGPSSRRTWFKRWIPSQVDAKLNKDTGKFDPKTPQAKVANELLIFRRPTRRRTNYGIPGYVSAMGWIFLSLAARDDNIHFFNNRREPRWAVILQNIEEDDDLEAALKEAFSTDLKKPHRNVFIPIEGDGKITFQKLTEDSKDVSFDKLQERAAGEILIAHRLPPDRLGMVRVGPLGGNATVAASRIYKEAVVIPSQKSMAARWNRFITEEGPFETPAWRWKPVELDITEEAADVETVTAAFTSNLLRWDEARKKVGQPAIGGEEGQKFFYELAPDAATASAAAGAAARAGASFASQVARSRSQRELTSAEDRIAERVRELLPDS